jgi:hypothetical protein
VHTAVSSRSPRFARGGADRLPGRRPRRGPGCRRGGSASRPTSPPPACRTDAAASRRRGRRGRVAGMARRVAGGAAHALGRGSQPGDGRQQLGDRPPQPVEAHDGQRVTRARVVEQGGEACPVHGAAGADANVRFGASMCPGRISVGPDTTQSGHRASTWSRANAVTPIVSASASWQSHGETRGRTGSAHDRWRRNSSSTSRSWSLPKKSSSPT